MAFWVDCLIKIITPHLSHCSYEADRTTSHYRSKFVIGFNIILTSGKYLSPLNQHTATKKKKEGELEEVLF